MDGVVPETDSITALFGRVRRGDQAAAITLWPWVERAASGSYKGLAERLELDEAVSDAYAKILRLAGVGRVDWIANREDLRRLLRLVVYRNLLNQLRRVRPKPDRRNQAEWFDPDIAADASPLPDAIAEIRDDLRRISETLCRRDPLYAEIFRLRLDNHRVHEYRRRSGRWDSSTPRTRSRWQAGR